MRILDGRHEELDRRILGVDVTDRHILPITRAVYYVDAHDPAGKLLIGKNTPAFCEYSTGDIFFLYDERIPLTEARLVHEFLHRAARRRYFFRYVSGIDTHHRYSEANEALTEYLTMRIIGEGFYSQVHPKNRYLEGFDDIRELEKKIGLTELTSGYLNGRRRVCRFMKESRHVRLAGEP